MINRTHRFHGYGSLRYVYQHGQTIRGPLCSLKFVHNDRRTDYRLAVVVSKKVSKSAVVRNRIRRQLYEAVRRLEAKIAGPYDMVLTVFHEQVKELSGQEVDRLVRAQLRQAGILSPAKKEPRAIIEGSGKE
jgi:ribonuclease P protein component